ncbi:MAG: hypothetical protein RR356_05485 [Bacteroidales bacterium]
MYEDEIKKQRVAILKGLATSAKLMLSNKIKNNSFIAITKDNQVQVVRAQEVNF